LEKILKLDDDPQSSRDGYRLTPRNAESESWIAYKLQKHHLLPFMSSDFHLFPQPIPLC